MRLGLNETDVQVAKWVTNRHQVRVLLAACLAAETEVVRLLEQQQGTYLKTSRCARAGRAAR